jgi:tRNA nucleotidyltransferase (CCA-adding enzyme)
MPDYIQLLESKLTPVQKQALNAITELARAKGTTVFLAGGAVRDIISGASVRDLDITVGANPLKFRKDLEKAGFTITGQHEPSQTVYMRYGRQARVEVSAARTESFAKPGKPEYRPATILADLHRRDFTANAMALSLNEGSWGLLLDPLNGSADIHARQLRLASNYGFLEDPIRMVRAIRLSTRTGWDMEERTKTRYENAKAEGVFSAVPATQRGYEMEEIAYEEDPLPVMRALEAEGWMEQLSPVWTSKSGDLAGIEKLHERLVQLLMAGLHPDPSAAQFRLLTAKLTPAQLSTLKKSFVRSDLIAESEGLDNEAKEVLQQITSKEAAKPSQLWKLLHDLKPEGVLWLFFTTKSATVQNRFESFFAKWPEARQKIPNALLQEMRITPDVPGYDELLDKLTFAFMDGELPDDAAIRKLAESYSPPAPPPAVTVRRSRAVKRVVEPRGTKGRGKKAAAKEAAAAGIPLAAAQDDGAASEQKAAAAMPPAQKAAGKPSKKGAAADAPKAAIKAVAAAVARPAAAKAAAKPAAKPAKAAAKPEKKAVAPAKSVTVAKRKPEAATKAASKPKAAKPKAASSKAPAKHAANSARAATPAKAAAPAKKAAAKSAKPAKAAAKPGSKAAKSKSRR